MTIGLFIVRKWRKSIGAPLALCFALYVPACDVLGTIVLSDFLHCECGGLGRYSTMILFV
jgi:hypothetical protein